MSTLWLQIQKTFDWAKFGKGRLMKPQKGLFIPSSARNEPESYAYMQQTSITSNILDEVWVEEWRVKFTDH